MVEVRVGVEVRVWVKYIGTYWRATIENRDICVCVIVRMSLCPLTFSAGSLRL